MRRRPPPLPDRSAGRRTLFTQRRRDSPQDLYPLIRHADARGATSDNWPPAPTYGPPITIPSGEFLGRIAYHAWCKADLSRPAVDWMELSEAERHTWRRVAQEVAERIRVATERSHALGNYLPPPRCPAKRRDRYTLYICCRWDPQPSDHGSDDEGHRWVPVEP